MQINCTYGNQKQTNIHTHPFNGPLIVRDYPRELVSEGKTNQDFTEARDSEWQWHIAPDKEPRHAAPHHSVFTGRMPFLPPNQQRRSTEGTETYTNTK